MGVGAFNLIRADVYRSIGTHEAIRLRPDDDMKLGKLVKRAGYKQDFALGDDLLAVEWYHTVGEMLRGLEKNALAPFRFNIGLLLLGLLPLGLFYLLPFVAPFVVTGWVRGVYLFMLLLSFVYYGLVVRFQLPQLLHFFLFPLTVPLFLYTWAGLPFSHGFAAGLSGGEPGIRLHN